LKSFAQESPVTSCGGQELELLVGEKERSIGAIRQHADEHKCQAALSEAAQWASHAEFISPALPDEAFTRKVFSTALFSVTALWTACTPLKIRVLTNAYFSLTEKIKGVQQDRSLTAS
jgi:hypothetical protein